MSIPYKINPDAVIADALLLEEQAVDRLIRSADSAARALDRHSNPTLADELRKAIADIKAVRVIREE